MFLVVADMMEDTRYYEAVRLPIIRKVLLNVILRSSVDHLHAIQFLHFGIHFDKSRTYKVALFLVDHTNTDSFQLAYDLQVLSINRMQISFNQSPILIQLLF
jgi:hypothetical protein